MDAELQEDCSQKDESSIYYDLPDVLRITVEPERNNREETELSKNVMRKQKNWERTLEVKRSKRKEEKKRKKLNRQNKGFLKLISSKF
ncbi:hypothetical protein DNTS_012032 [Danionella cerebrum]|uniref:Uncharacterized protein n=1 Tax=Danionella cerebrum TaxID=2873325 RepID=A0A553MX41_9TELE|nr:hypothetical protein DNTS_012032 [Danionella translucida]